MVASLARTCLVVRHVAFEDLGLLGPLLSARGYEIRFLEAGVDPLNADDIVAPDLAVVLGGPIGVYETDAYPFITDEIKAVAARLTSGKPILGICLGAQLMTAALGARVAPGPVKEIGWAPVMLSDAGKNSVLAPLAGVPVLHWHGDNCDLPSGCTQLASTAPCPVQAFIRSPSQLGLQFHVEVEPARIERWLIGHTVELGKAGIDPRTLRAQAAEHGAETAAAGRAVLSAWLDSHVGAKA
ncbi:MAG TPA: glutamine amidotransferase [Xanthobacteraceae bacterium]|jgi:GMP synthase (glutamine-hydrolysing)|nr:glutamine amidotransferase [Xanthobacteraceae bacterium]